MNVALLQTEGKVLERAGTLHVTIDICWICKAVKIHRVSSENEDRFDTQLHGNDKPRALHQIDEVWEPLFS